MKLQFTTEAPVNGLNRVLPSHELPPGQLQKSMNMYPTHGVLKKVEGTERYNLDSLGNHPITWVHRYYGRKADGQKVKKVFCFYDDAIYVGNDQARTLSAVESGFNKGGYPSSEIIQVGGNARMYFFNEGKDVPYYYEGGTGNTFYQSAITLQPIMGVAWLDRLWVFEENSNVLYYSKNLDPENFTDSTDAGEIQIGISKREIIMGIIRYNDTLYIFSDRKIYYISGRTPSTFSVREIHANLGLGATHALCAVEASIVFMGSDFELYSFDGSLASIRCISLELNFRDMINPLKAERVVCGYHNDLLRVSFEPFSQESTTVFNSDELITNVKDFGQNGQPKWGHARGTNVSCYSVWNRFGDRNELVTGRSDNTGCLMFHGRTNNFDGQAIEIQARTRDIVASLDTNVRIPTIYVNGKTNGENTIVVRSYLDTRNSEYSTNDISQEGEVYTLGFIRIAQQAAFNERMQLDIDKSKGQMISIEIWNNTLDRDIQIYSFSVGIRKSAKKLKATIGA